MKRWYEFRAQAKGAEIVIYDEIGAFGIPAKAFVDELKALGPVAELTVRVNSPGGSVFDGVAIYNALKRHNAAITVWIDGIAASIASMIATAGDEVVMPENAMLMLHDPSALVIGTATDTYEGSERIIAEHERRIAEIEALRAKDGSNAEAVDQLIARSAAVRDAQLSQLRAKEIEAAEKVRAANEKVVAGLDAERAALSQTERERFVAQATNRLSAEATAQQRREVEQLAGALYDEQQALQARQRLLDEGRSVIDRTRTATEQHAAEIAKLNQLLQAGAIDQTTYARAVEDANDRALRSSQAWTDGATRFLEDYVAESNDAATVTEQAFANAFRGAEDALVGFIGTGKLEFQGLADSILADLTRIAVRQTITAPIAGALQSAFAGGGLFGLFHEGGTAGERPPAVRHADAAVFEHAPRYHGGGFAGSGLLPDEVPIIARRGELVVPPERVVREEKTAREQRPITVVVNVTAADANSFRASQGQIAADMARAIDRASRNR